MYVGKVRLAGQGAHRTTLHLTTASPLHLTESLDTHMVHQPTEYPCVVWCLAPLFLSHLTTHTYALIHTYRYVCTYVHVCMLLHTYIQIVQASYGKQWKLHTCTTHVSSVRGSPLEGTTPLLGMLNTVHAYSFLSLVSSLATCTASVLR